MIKKIMITFIASVCLLSTVVAEELSKDQLLGILLKKELKERSVNLKLQKKGLEKLERDLDMLKGSGRVKGHIVTAGLGALSLGTALILKSDADAHIKVGAGAISAGFGFAAFNNWKKVESEISQFEEMIREYKADIEESQDIVDRLTFMTIAGNRAEVLELIEEIIEEMNTSYVLSVDSLKTIRENKEEIEHSTSVAVKKYGLGITSGITGALTIYFAFLTAKQTGLSQALAMVGTVAVGGVSLGTGLGAAGVSNGQSNTVSRLDTKIGLCEKEIEYLKQSMIRLEQIKNQL